MTAETRHRLALLTLVVSALAFLGTSEPAPRATQSVQGDVTLSPDRPTEIAVRFVVDPRKASSIDVVQLNFDLPYWPELFSLRIEASTGAQTHVAPERSIEIPPEECRAGCTIDATAVLTWVARVAPEVRVGWGSELALQYGGDYPPESSPITATVVSGAAPAVPRLGWVVMGAALAVATGVMWLLAGVRFRRARLVIAASGIVSLAWVGLFQGVIYLPFVERYVDLLIPFAGLALGILFGLRALGRGDGLYLRIVGGLCCFGIVLDLWYTTTALPVYRPTELVALGFLALAPGMAAVTSGPLAHGLPRTVWARGSATLMASQGILLFFLTIVGAMALIALSDDLSVVLAGGPVYDWVWLLAAPLVVILLLALSTYRWRRGSTFLLVFVNLFLLVPAALLGLAVFAPNTLFSASIEAQVPVVIFIGAAAIGAVGGLRVRPPLPAAPPAEPDGEGKRGETDEVGRVGYEGDGDDAGDAG